MKKLFFFGLVFISYFAKADNQWQEYKVNNNPTHSDIYAVGLDNNNNLYVSVPNGFFKFDNNIWTDITNYKDYPHGNYYFLRSKKLILSSGGDSILGTSQEGFMIYKISTNETTFFNRKKIMGDWDYTFPTGLALDKNGGMWFTSRNPTLHKFDGSKFIDWNLETPNSIFPIGFSGSDNILAIDTNIWLGGLEGVLRFSIFSTKDTMIYFKYTMDDLQFTNETSMNQCYDLCYDKRNNTIWATDNNGNISYFKENKWNKLSIPDSLRPPDYENNGKIVKPSIKLSIDSANNLLLFWDHSDNFLILDSNGKFTKILYPTEYLDSYFKAIKIRQCIVDKDGNYWIVKFYPTRGFVKYTPTKTSVQTDDYELIPDIYIRKIYPNPSNNFMKAELLIYPNNIDKVKIGLYNYMGIKMMDLKDQLELNSSTGEAYLTFDISSLPDGAYYLCIEKGNERKSKGILKIRK